MLVKLVDDVRTALVARFGDDVFVDEGPRARNTQDNFAKAAQNRVVFLAAEDSMPVIPPLRIGEGDVDINGLCRRQLFNFNFVFNVCMAGYDSTNPDRDLAHRRRCIDLWEVVAQVVQSDYGGVSEWAGAVWSLERKDGVYGAELIATLLINIPIFDIDWATATPAGVPGQPKPLV